jgi:hypothetical protein
MVESDKLGMESANLNSAIRPGLEETKSVLTAVAHR